MKTLSYALLVLFTFFGVAMQAETDVRAQKISHKKVFSPKGGKDKWNCDDCKSRCSLKCLKSEKCTLTFDIRATNFSETLTGNFLISIVSPNGETVATSTIDASTIGASTDFFMTVPAPICAGLYKVNVTNINATFNPFFLIVVTNSCNNNCVQISIPAFEQNSFGSFPNGWTFQSAINILPHFVHFGKCEEHCKCEEKSGE